VLNMQGRFRHLKDEEINRIQEQTTANWQHLLEIDGKQLF